MAAVTETTLEERIETLERKLSALVDGLAEEVVGVVTPTIGGITWDPDYNWDMPGDELYEDFEPGPRGAWRVEWLNREQSEVESVTHW